MDIDTFMVVAFVVLIGLLAAIVLVGIPRGKRMQSTNERIEANQRRTIEMSERQLALSERNVAAMERIAAALERRDG